MGVSSVSRPVPTIESLSDLKEARKEFHQQAKIYEKRARETLVRFMSMARDVKRLAQLPGYSFFIPLDIQENGRIWRDLVQTVAAERQQGDLCPLAVSYFSGITLIIGNVIESQCLAESVYNIAQVYLQMEREMHAGFVAANTEIKRREVMGEN